MYVIKRIEQDKVVYYADKKQTSVWWTTDERLAFKIGSKKLAEQTVKRFKYGKFSIVRLVTIEKVVASFKNKMNRD